MVLANNLLIVKDFIKHTSYTLNKIHSTSNTYIIIAGLIRYKKTLTLLKGFHQIILSMI